MTLRSPLPDGRLCSIGLRRIREQLSETTDPNYAVVAAMENASSTAAAQSESNVSSGPYPAMGGAEKRTCAHRCWNAVMEN